MIAAGFTVISETLCETVDLRAGDRVLDVATGTGNTALSAARRQCRVTGVDFVPAHLERGRLRAEAEGLQIEFIEGDAEDLPFTDGSFDVVLSTLGAMFVPNQQKAADELLRVCRPGGKIGMANWTPDGWAAQFGQIVGRYLHFGGAPASPFAWGCERQIKQLLGDRALVRSAVKRSFLARHTSAQDYWLFFQKATGWDLNLQSRLDEEQRKAFSKDVIALIERLNCSNDHTVVIPQEYLEVVAVRSTDSSVRQTAG